MSETYHGVSIPEDIWEVWDDAFEEGPHGFRLGVLAARGIERDDRADQAERDRLGNLAKARRDAEQKAWQKQHDEDLKVWRTRRLGEGED